MKHRDLLKIIKNFGWKFHRHGGNHDVYAKGNRKVMIPRHKIIGKYLAKAILKECNIK